MATRACRRCKDPYATCCEGACHPCTCVCGPDLHQVVPAPVVVPQVPAPLASGLPEQVAAQRVAEVNTVLADLRGMSCDDLGFVPPAEWSAEEFAVVEPLAVPPTAMVAPVPDPVAAAAAQAASDTAAAEAALVAAAIAQAAADAAAAAHAAENDE